MTKSRIWETAALLLVAFTLFRPGFWLDKVSPPYDEIQGPAILEAAVAHPEGEPLRLRVVGPDFDYPDKIARLTVLAQSEVSNTDGVARLADAGLEVVEDDEGLELIGAYRGSFDTS